MDIIIKAKDLLKQAINLNNICKQNHHHTQINMDINKLKHTINTSDHANLKKYINIINNDFKQISTECIHITKKLDSVDPWNIGDYSQYCHSPKFWLYNVKQFVDVCKDNHHDIHFFGADVLNLKASVKGLNKKDPSPVIDDVENGDVNSNGTIKSECMNIKNFIDKCNKTNKINQENGL